MEQTKIYEALKGARGRKPVDLDALEKLIVQFSRLVVEQPWIKEIDINPLLARPGEQAVALDARVIVHGPDAKREDLPKPAIRPYPVQYASPWTMKDGSRLLIRPIRPEDEPMMIKFHQNVSERSVYFRFFHMLNLSYRTAHERLTRICFIDYDRETALVAEHKNAETGEKEILAVGRLVKQQGENEAEFAILIADKYQRSGLGTGLLKRLVGIGRKENNRRIKADILYENRGMQRVCEKLGFRLHYDSEEEVVKAVIDI